MQRLFLNAEGAFLCVSGAAARCDRAARLAGTMLGRLRRLGLGDRFRNTEQEGC